MKLKTFFAMALASVAAAATAFSTENNVMHLSVFIDDGPSENTAAVLDILKAEGIHANFDLTGENVQKHPELAVRILAEGHAINDHSLNHRHPRELDDGQLLADMKGGYDAILKATGKAPTAYWPPFIEYDERMTGILKGLNLQMYRFPMIASGEVWDRLQTAAEVKERALANVKDGCVLLFHEWRPDTFAVFQEILKELKRRGCVFLTYEELAAYDESLKK